MKIAFGLLDGHHPHPAAFVVALLALLASCGEGAKGPTTVAAALPAKEAPRYGRDIRPILSDRCFKCHGGDAAKREADLRLDIAEGATKPRPGGTAIVASKPAESLVLARIASRDPAFMMPPPSSNKAPLDASEQELIREWVAAGAVYEPHWAFEPPRKTEPPASRFPERSNNIVDRFIHARLDQAGLAPSPEADKTTLVRRLFLDVTGLPPAPEEIDAFLADDAPGAYDALVHRLLHDEPYRSRFAERMATPWLDAARYADTSGIHMDAGRSIWPWRDWVLRAFRDNKPFDAFVTEQLAGDLLPDATQDQKVASGFNRNHVTTDEGGAINEEYLVEYAVDRVATTGSVFLGLTLGCSRCHDHKYDPVSQEDFYKFFAFFNSNEEPGLYSQLPNPERALEPSLSVPSAMQTTERERISGALAARKDERISPRPGEEGERARFFTDLEASLALSFPPFRILDAASARKNGAVLSVTDDGSILASGPNPDTDEHHVRLGTEATNLRVLIVEALTDPSLPMTGPGRAPNGNAVLSSIDAVVTSVSDPARTEEVRFDWAAADFEQDDGDYGVANALTSDSARGFAIGAHKERGNRVLVLAARKSFGFDGGSTITVRLRYESRYAQHVFGRIRVAPGTLSETALDRLPVATSAWYRTGPFPTETGDDGYAARFGPEDATALDLAATFGKGKNPWKYSGFKDGKTESLPAGKNVHYLARTVHAPSARTIEASFGSDDGIQVFLNGQRVHENKVERAVAADQEKVSLPLVAGANVLLVKVVNTGGEAGFYHRALARSQELGGDLALALVPASRRGPPLEERLQRAWRLLFSPEYRRLSTEIEQLETGLKKLDAAIPATMVMKERATPRPTFVLTRGQYDHPDQSRPVSRGLPSVFADPSAPAPKDRLDLARWLTSERNPLVARVAVNRVFEIIFGSGLVRTTEDFGLQGEWPSHPELLDWLAVDFRENGWDLKRLIAGIVSSATYRQASKSRPELAERDAENRLLAVFPRRRLGAEAIRDLALYASGLLVERFGGPSVKIYQPAGLWEDVAMPQSNTRVYRRGDGPDLWRRGLYTYWKRASPPPSLLTLDAPTREFCNVKRITTNTPLQAFVLWNDEQFVEAARVGAERTLGEPGDDQARLSRLFRRATSRIPDEQELRALNTALGNFRIRYSTDPEAAKKLVKTGAAMVNATLDASELAAWTMVANAILNLDASINRG